jgi:hypothetical protein
LTLPGLELRPLGRPARSQSPYRLRYSGSTEVAVIIIIIIIFDKTPLFLAMASLSRCQHLSSFRQSGFHFSSVTNLNPLRATSSPEDQVPVFISPTPSSHRLVQLYPQAPGWFPLRRLLQLKGSRWRCSDVPLEDENHINTARLHYHATASTVCVPLSVTAVQFALNQAQPIINSLDIMESNRFILRTLLK